MPADEEPVVAIIMVRTDGKSFGFEIETELEDEVMETVLRSAADQVGHKNDRAAGAWGRS